MASEAILKNLKKILISSQPIDEFLTKFGMPMRLDSLHPIANKILRFQKSKMVVAAIWIIKKWQYLCFG